jgi:hypothetical protein
MPACRRWCWLRAASRRRCSTACPDDSTTRSGFNFMKQFRPQFTNKTRFGRISIEKSFCKHTQHNNNSLLSYFFSLALLLPLKIVSFFPSFPFYAIFCLNFGHFFVPKQGILKKHWSLDMLTQPVWRFDEVDPLSEDVFCARESRQGLNSRFASWTFAVVGRLRGGAGLPDGLFSYQKLPIWISFGGS